MKNKTISRDDVVFDNNTMSTPRNAENEERTKKSMSGNEIIIQIFSKLEKLLLTKKLPKLILQIKNVMPINKNFKNSVQSLI